MKPILLISCVLTFLLSCSNTPKELKGVKTGMTKEQVLTFAGEPTSRNNLEIADLWVYEDADRTIVFRNDTVFNIITTANARIDSIKSSLKNAGYSAEENLSTVKDSIKKNLLKAKDSINENLKNARVPLKHAGLNIKKQFNSAADSIDSVAKKLKNDVNKKINK